MTTQPYPLCSTLRGCVPPARNGLIPVAPMRKLRLGEGWEPHASQSDPQLARGTASTHATATGAALSTAPSTAYPSLKQAFRQAGAHGTHPQAQTGDQ